MSVTSATCPDGRCDGSGFVVDPVTRSAQPCSCRTRRVADRRAQNLRGQIPQKFRHLGFERRPVTDIAAEFPAAVQTVKEWIDDLDDELARGHGLALCGGVGTGKTTLAMLASQQALERGRSVAVFSVPRLLNEIRTTYEAESRAAGGLSSLGLLDALARVDLLHLEDLGAERVTDWVREQLYAIVDARYTGGRAITYTSNLDPTDETFAEQLGDRTVSRLKEMCFFVPMHGEDRRPPLY